MINYAELFAFIKKTKLTITLSGSDNLSYIFSETNETQYNKSHNFTSIQISPKRFDNKTITISHTHFTKSRTHSFKWAEFRRDPSSHFSSRSIDPQYRSDLGVRLCRIFVMFYHSGDWIYPAHLAKTVWERYEWTCRIAHCNLDRVNMTICHTPRCWIITLDKVNCLKVER